MWDIIIILIGRIDTSGLILVPGREQVWRGKERGDGWIGLLP